MNLSFANVRSVLEHCGPMTMREVACYFPGCDYHDVSSILSAMRLKTSTRQVHICGWAASTCGGAAVPVWMWGDAFDAEEPKSTGEDGVRRIERCSYRTIAKLRTSFVPGQFDPFRVLRAQVAV